MNGAGAYSRRIKGKISRRGLRIYYVLSGRRYDYAPMDRAKGERGFCSEADATAASSRRSH
jgi:hypothetical protein